MEGIPPWIKPAEPAAYWQPAFNAAGTLAQSQSRLAQEAADTAAQIQMRQQALAQEGQQAAMQMEIKRQELERESRIREQQLAIEHAYRQAQLGIERGRLAEDQKMNEMKVLESARVMQAQDQYERDYASMVQEGVSAGLSEQEAIDEATIKAATRNPEMLKRSPGMGSIVGAAMRRRATLPQGDVTGQRLVDPDTGERIPDFILTPGAAGQPNVHRIGAQNTALKQHIINAATAAIDKIRTEIRTNAYEGDQLKKAQADILERKRQANSELRAIGEKEWFSDATEEGWTTSKSGLKVRLRQ